jgi:hypothetical protein
MARTSLRIVLPLLVSGVLGCSADPSSPTAPTAANVSTATAPTAPIGSIVINGTVFDTAYRPLPGATVEVLDGPQAGLSVTAGPRGLFSLNGIFDATTRFRATANNHVVATKTLQPFCARCQPNWWVHFTLDVPESPVNLAGDYALNFAANPGCTMLPEEMRSRTFTATIPATSLATPTDGLRISGATFFEDWDTIGVGVAGNYVGLWLETLVEQIAPNTFLAFAGEASGIFDASSSAAFELRFDGAIEYCVTAADKGRFPDCHGGPATTRRCQASHQLTLTRR